MKRESQFLVVKPRPEAAFKLFCFPHAGGGPIAFFNWSEQLGGDIECVCVQYPGRGQRLREEPLTCIHDVVDDVMDAFVDSCQKPFAFYGHSFGGVVAFELARRMRRDRMPEPSHLFVGATRPPHLEFLFPPIHHLPEQEFVENIQRRYSGIPAAISQDPEIMKMFMPALRADFTAYETYRFRSEDPLNIPITAFAGAEDRAVKPECLHNWELHTSAGFEMEILPGGHFFSSTSGRELIGALKGRIAHSCELSGFPISRVKV